ncbi:MAG: hypothetical protein ACRENS_06045, partial [Candidatus Eiseniibacteriota bacterium]
MIPAAAAAWVFRGALPYFFAQDDFLGLARARGLAPPLALPWRWISGQLYFELMRPFGIASATPYHLVSVLAHAATAALLALLLARRVSLPAALAGAVYFAAHPSLYTALYSVSGIGEILSALFVLLTLLLADRPGNARWLAAPAFAAALLCKESVLLLPLALLAGRARVTPSFVGARQPLIAIPKDLSWALAAVAAGVAAWLFASDVFAVRTGLASRAPYAFSLDGHMFANAATYLGWAVQPWLILARGFQDAVDPAVLPAAALGAGLWLAGLAWPRLRPGLWWSGAVLFSCLLAPVLPLRNHTYHYYLYAPLIGISCCLAALFDALLTAAKPALEGRLAWAAALGATALFIWNGAAFVREIETHPFTD